MNRALVCQGLKVMARRARPGIAALLDVAQTRDRPTAFTCGFALGPRINAAGRISEADLGLRLLLCEDPVEATALATLLDDVNRQRQEVEAAVLDAAMHAAEAQAAAGHAALLVCGEGWHPGVVGIVAGRIKERFNRPACVAGIADGVAKGSGRSVAGLDLGAAVIAARQAGILTTGGGHPMAAGFLAAGGADRCVPCVPERAAGGGGGAAECGGPGGGGHAGGGRGDHRAGAAAGAAGAVRGRQRGADAGAAARPRGARRPGGRGRRPPSAPSSKARAAGRG